MCQFTEQTVRGEEFNKPKTDLTLVTFCQMRLEYEFCGILFVCLQLLKLFLTVTQFQTVHIHELRERQSIYHTVICIKVDVHEQVKAKGNRFKVFSNKEECQSHVLRCRCHDCNWSVAMRGSSCIKERGCVFLIYLRRKHLLLYFKSVVTYKLFSISICFPS